jgi:GntR family transcriptional regulator
MTPTVSIDPDSPVPPYEQLRRQFAVLVRSGALTAGDQLPTVRQLARDLGISKNTVVRAFQELERNGVVVAAGRRGTVVVEPTDLPPRRDATIDRAAHRFMADVHHLEPTLDELLAAVRRAASRDH